MQTWTTEEVIFRVRSGLWKSLPFQAWQLTIEASEERSDLIFFDRTKRRAWLRPRLPREPLSQSDKIEFQSPKLLSESEKSSSRFHSIDGKDSTLSSSNVMSLNLHASPAVLDSKLNNCLSLLSVILRLAFSKAAVAGRVLSSKHRSEVSRERGRPTIMLGLGHIEQRIWCAWQNLCLLSTPWLVAPKCHQLVRKNATKV